MTYSLLVNNTKLFCKLANNLTKYGLHQTLRWRQRWYLIRPKVSTNWKDWQFKKILLTIATVKASDLTHLQCFHFLYLVQKKINHSKYLHFLKYMYFISATAVFRKSVTRGEITQIEHDLTTIINIKYQIWYKCISIFLRVSATFQNTAFIIITAVKT
jgi:hypothetical protein